MISWKDFHKLLIKWELNGKDLQSTFSNVSNGIDSNAHYTLSLAPMLWGQQMVSVSSQGTMRFRWSLKTTAQNTLDSVQGKCSKNSGNQSFIGIAEIINSDPDQRRVHAAFENVAQQAKEANGIALELYCFGMPTDIQGVWSPIRSPKWLQWGILEKGDMTLRKTRHRNAKKQTTSPRDARKCIYGYN